MGVMFSIGTVSMIKKVYIKICKILGFTESYAKISGVNFGVKCKFSKIVDFGSEPYLITIGNHFYCSSNITFITHDGSVNVIRNLFEQYRAIDLFGRINVGNNVFLGYGVVLLPGVDIGDNVIVGANSLVKGTLLSNSVYAGSPARYICSIEDFHNKKKGMYIYTKYMSSTDKELNVRKSCKL